MAIYKLGLDIGNSGIKMAGKIGKDYKLECIKALTTRSSSDSSYVVQLDGDRPLYFGVGEPLTVQDKTKRRDFKETILLAVATIYGEVTDCDVVKIAVGLPLGDYKTDHKRKQYEEETLKSITQVSGEVNGKYYFFKVELTVCAEGFSAFYYLMPNLDKSYRWLISDHGFRTTDVVGVSYNSERKRWIVDGYKSESYGLLEMYEGIAKRFSDDLGGALLDVQDVEYYMKENIKVITESPEVPEANLNDYSIGAKDTIDLIYEKLHTKFTDLPARKILLLGGGGELVHKHLDRHNKSCEENAIKRLYANAIGFYLQIKD